MSLLLATNDLNAYRASLRRYLAAVLIACGVLPARGEEAPLHERPPSVLVVLDASGDSAELEILPLPDGTPTRPPLPRSGDLVARLVSSPSEEIAIPFASIARIEPFPERLLSTAKRFAAAGDYGQAYGCFARLDREYPDHPGFTDAFAAALRAEAVTLFRDGKYDHALALLGSLNDRYAAARGLGKAVDSIGDAILKSRWAAEDYTGVRQAIDAIEGQFSGLRLTLAERWLGRMEEGAARERRRAERLAAAGNPREALRVVAGALALAPDSVETNRLLQKLSENDKTLWVGVWEVADEGATPRLDTPAARRHSRLVGGRLATLESYEVAGGRYASPLGSLIVEDGKRRLTLELNDRAAPDAAFRLSRALLGSSGDDGPLALLRRRTASVAIDPSGRLRLQLRGPHPQPEALAATALPRDLAGLAAADWRRVDASATGANARYQRVSGTGAFDVIEEYVFDDADEAIQALRDREVHVLVDVPAWKLPALRATPGIDFEERRLPTLHTLLIGPESAIRQRREVRRAIDYAIARKETLQTVVLGGARRTGFETLSAPFPWGRTLSDSLRYAYNDSVEKRPYDPRLAALLLRAAQAEDVEPEGSEAAAEASPPAPATLTLAHPPTPVARLASAAIGSQLEQIGFGVEIIEKSESALASGEVAYDLRYAEITVGEPLVDAWALLGPGGVSGGCSAALREGLEQVIRAPNGATAAAALQDLHRIVFAEVPLIPLWQTVDVIAYQDALRGVPESSVDVYQTVDDWRIAIRRKR